MKHIPFAFAALIALALAACNKAAEPNNVAIDNEAASANATEMVAPVESNAINNAAAANESAATPAKLPSSIPAQFHGRWGLTSVDCTSTKGDAKGLLTINDARLTFYESRGALDKVIGATATSFDARYAFSGEGQTWQRTERLNLVDGKLQRRTDAEPGQEPPVNLTYDRCAD